MAITHKCTPDTECFCIYDPECNPDAVHVRYIPAEITDDMVQRAAKGIYEARGKIYGRWVDGRRPGIRQWATLEWDELDGGQRWDFEQDARAALTAALREEHR